MRDGERRELEQVLDHLAAARKLVSNLSNPFELDCALSLAESETRRLHQQCRDVADREAAQEAIKKMKVSD